MSGLSSDAFARWVKTYRMIQSAGSLKKRARAVSACWQNSARPKLNSVFDKKIVYQ